MKSYSILLAVFLVAGTSVFAAEAPKSPDAKSEAPVVHNKTLWEQIKEGGWVMVPIGVCSVLTLYLMGDGFLRVTNPKKLLPSEEIEAVKSLYRQGKYNDAYQFCKSRASAFANVTRVATSQLGEGKSATEEGVIAEIMKENSRMQTFISYLSVIGVCTPMIGLVGTVTGMMGAFATLGTSGIGDLLSFRPTSVRCWWPQPLACLSPFRRSQPTTGCGTGRPECCMISRTPCPS
ncbi:MotA/TolQ/ExbB proton channel family protein [Verrucomicrobium spinosum]|uniref:MotA/TolQ/ExbB proton channel family protein n=1 Tax=Verrucomicrobium spinosum TaxID=2736 RepID=UPI00094668E4|nr:MotA/TolQ/ExbB proton channel family protein [Verrucomicrobium spinosum]